MNAEEKSIASKLSRRGFMGMGVTAAATLAALTGREPQVVRAAGPEATADSIIVLWMAGGMAQTETFDPKRYTPFEPGVRTERVLSTFPAIDTVGRQYQNLPGARARRQGDGPRVSDPDVPGRGSRIHTPFAASVSLAHGIHSAAIAGSPAYRSGHRQDTGAEESKRAAVYFDRPEHGDRGRERVDQGVSYGGLPGDGIRALS